MKQVQAGFNCAKPGPALHELRGHVHGHEKVPAMLERAPRTRLSRAIEFYPGLREGRDGNPHHIASNEGVGIPALHT
jgi:hypothetical protein